MMTSPDRRHSDDLVAMVNAGNLPAARDGRFLLCYHDHDQRMHEVRLLHGLAGHRHPPALEHVRDGIYAIAFDAPQVDRLEYRFELVGQENARQSVRDPLNHQIAEDPHGGKSVLAAQRYEQPWYVETVPIEARGSMKPLTLPGPNGATWRAALWLPPDDDLGRPMPLIIALDGEDSLRYAKTANIIANLVHRQAIARCRALFISPAKRNNEYSANPQTAAMLAREIPHRLERELPLPDQEQRIGLGQSLGALALLHAHWHFRGFFGGLLLQSGSFFQPHTDAVESKFAYFQRITGFVKLVHDSRHSSSPISVRLTCGLGEENLTNNMKMAETLSALGYDAMLTATRDAHNWTSWRDAMGPALQSLLPG